MHVDEGEVGIDLIDQGHCIRQRQSPADNLVTGILKDALELESQDALVLNDDDPKRSTGRRMIDHQLTLRGRRSIGRSITTRVPGLPGSH